MLVLSRKAEQKIRIGNNITVTILKITGSVVRLGVEAPQGVRILRAELADKPLQPDEKPQKTAPSDGLAAASPESMNLADRLRLRVDEGPRGAESRVESPIERPDESRSANAPPKDAALGSARMTPRFLSHSDTPRCPVPRAGFNSPGRHPLRVGPASAAVGGAPMMGRRREWDSG